MTLRTISFYLMLLAIFATNAQANLERRYLKFIDKNAQGANIMETTYDVAPDYANNPSKSSAKNEWINVIFDENMPDSIQASVILAKQQWEKRMPDAMPVYIYAEYIPLSSDISVETTVGYYAGDGEMSGCPSSLASQIFHQSTSSEESLDGIISFNSSLHWNCDVSAYRHEGYNAFTMALRSFAKCFGFGSGICKSQTPLHGNYYTTKDGFFTYYDKNLRTPNEFLYTIPILSSDFNKYVQNGPLVVWGASGDKWMLPPRYKVYTSMVFSEGISLSTLNEASSLMYYGIGEGDKFTYIDKATASILNYLGWKFTAEYAESEITATGFDGRNVGSAYLPHILSLTNVSQSTEIEYEWEMFLKKENGLFSLFTTDSNSTFTIPEIDAPNSYQINSDKELEAIIRCSYKRNDTTYVTPFFHCYLDLKPRILSIDDVTITNKPDYIYSVSFYVRYCGSDHVHVEADNENSSYVERFDFYQPEYAHVEVPRMDEFVANWIIVSVQNEFGTATEQLDFPATYDPYASTIRNESAAQQLVSAQIYKTDGFLVYSGKESATAIQHMSPGIYIITYRYADGRIKTDKIIIQ